MKQQSTEELQRQEAQFSLPPLQIANQLFLCHTEHTAQARLLWQCTWTMWNTAQKKNQAGDVVDGYQERERKTVSFPQLCSILGSHYGEMSFQ